MPTWQFNVDAPPRLANVAAGDIDEPAPQPSLIADEKPAQCVIARLADIVIFLLFPLNRY